MHSAMWILFTWKLTNMILLYPELIRYNPCTTVIQWRYNDNDYNITFQPSDSPPTLQIAPLLYSTIVGAYYFSLYCILFNVLHQFHKSTLLLCKSNGNNVCDSHFHDEHHNLLKYSTSFYCASVKDKASLASPVGRYLWVGNHDGLQVKPAISQVPATHTRKHTHTFSNSVHPMRRERERRSLSRQIYLPQNKPSSRLRTKGYHREG